MLHFTRGEFDTRLAQTRAKLNARDLDVALLFAPESHYWLTGYDTFGYCFFQCLVVTLEGLHLLTRSADLRQAQKTSVIEDIRIWVDGTDPGLALREMLGDLGLQDARLGIELDTHGLTARNHQRVLAATDAPLTDISDVIPALRDSHRRAGGLRSRPQAGPLHA